MIKSHDFVLAALVVLLASELILGEEINAALDGRDVQRRDYDTFKVFNRKRNAHACIMSIVFIVLYPLGAISVHLPIDRIPVLRNTYLKKKIMAIHAPIQILGLVMMTGGMALGIRIAHDLGYFEKGQLQHHMVIGLIVVCIIIVFQPILGMLQHQHYKKTGGKSIFAYAHRWIGRCAIILGIINNGIGFQLASRNIIIPHRSYIRNFVIAGVLVLIWFGLVLYDMFVAGRPRAVADGGEKGGVFASNGASVDNSEARPSRE